MPQARFEQAVSVSERTQTHALDCAAIGTSTPKNLPHSKFCCKCNIRPCRNHSEWQIYVGQNTGPSVIRTSL